MWILSIILWGVGVLVGFAWLCMHIMDVSDLLCKLIVFWPFRCGVIVIVYNGIATMVCVCRCVWWLGVVVLSNLCGCLLRWFCVCDFFGCQYSPMNVF